MTVRSARDGLREAFLHLAPPTLDGDPGWLRDLRRTALAHFAEHGFPTTHDEAWRYTSLQPIEESPLDPGSDGPGEEPREEALLSWLGGLSSAPRLVFVDGRYSTKLSAPGPLPSGVRAGSLAEALVTAEDAVRSSLNREPEPADAFAALNTAFWQDGAALLVPAGTALGQALHLVFVASGQPPGRVAHPRNLVVLERQSEACVVEHYVSLAGGVCLTNARTDVVLGDGSVLDHYRLLRESATAFHVGRTGVIQARDSQLSSCTVALGGRLIRQDLDVRLEGEGAGVALRGLVVLGGRQHVDTHTVVDHARPHGTSRQLYKGVLDGHARSVFDGRIVVRPGAQKTDAHQTNKNLLLSDGVEVDSKPQLEIFADDVKCSHGAADGQLAGDALFYLASRGLGESTARALLTLGFAAEVLAQLRDANVRSHLETLLAARLRDGRVADG
jgi:Fe-S cluster assembly protein SufD